jgi:transcriptional regulator with XRE-family HTH domain
MNVGLQLRHVREQQRLTLRDVSNRTKVPIGALEAIERNDLAHLPGGIFTRGFVRSYAAAVGLDPTDVVQDFLAQFDAEQVEAVDPPIREAQQYQDDAPASRTPLLAMLLVGGSLAVYAAYGGSPETDAQSSPASLLPASPVHISSQELVRPPTPNEVPVVQTRSVERPLVPAVVKAMGINGEAVSARPTTKDALESAPLTASDIVVNEPPPADAPADPPAGGTSDSAPDPGIDQR